MKRARRLFALALVAVAPATVAACGDSNDDSNAQAPQQSTNASQSISPQTVKATEGEWTVKTAPAAVKSGEVRFAVDNQGKLEHEFVVLRTQRRAADLADGKEAAEPGNVGEVEGIAPGAKANKTLRLRPGHYALICNLPGHYKAGMYTDFDVR
jgi:uncharacterized cupredoxin-like copper-binding protein